MRISTGMIYDAGVSAINAQTSSLLQLQQQVSTGRRIVTPSDDPVSAAQALVVTQAKDVAGQYATNQDNAKSALGLEESQLTSVGDLLTRVRELAIQANNGTVSANDRRSIAQELRSDYDQLLGLANSTDASGSYIFSGYMGGTKPFGGTVDQLNAAVGNEISYQGDDGQRRLQVAASRQLEISDSGNDVFKTIRNGNGYFTTTYGSQNQGTGMVDSGAITDPAKWNASLNNTAMWGTAVPNKVEVRFWTDTNGIVAGGKAGDVYYDIVDTNGVSLYTGQKSTSPDESPAPATPASFTAAHKYQDGQTITLNGFTGGTNPYNGLDMGASVVITGTPQGGATTTPAPATPAQDGFVIAPSSTQSVFKTLATLIGTLERSVVGSAGTAKYSIDIGSALTNLDQAQENILGVRAKIGARLSEIDALGNVNQDVTLQYQQTLSQLQDLDYTKAISDLTRNQTTLDAAQKSFMKVSQLSLFNYL